MTARPGPAGPIRRVVVVTKSGSLEGTSITSKLAEWLDHQGIEARYDRETAAAIKRSEVASREPLPADVDLAIVAGGDGTLLSVARSAAPLGIPILGINFGSLGFLTELQADEMFAGLEAVLAGRYDIEERQTLRVRYRRRNGEVREYALLNDVVITKSALARMIDLSVRVDGQDVATYTSDGLIVATPTGSTAYNLSAGGPILDPRMGAFVISPICPHTLTYRPLVVPRSVVIDVSLHSDDEEVYLTLDGQVGFPFHPEEELSMDDHPQPVRLLRLAGRSFFEVLRRKLRWGER